MTRTVRTRRRLRNERAQTLAEFALILPILAILIFGLVDAARAYNAWVTVQGAAREGVRYGVTGRTTCGITGETRLACIEHQARTQTKPLANASTEVDVAIHSWDYPTYDPSTELDGAGESCDAIEVEVSYKYEPATPIIKSLIGGVTMTAKQRMVNEPFGNCT